METPTSLGGLGHRYRVKLAFAEELARGDMAFTFSLINTQNAAARLAASRTTRHRETHVPALMRGEIFGATALTESHAGSDFAAIATLARRADDGGWRAASGRQVPPRRLRTHRLVAGGRRLDRGA